MPENENNTESAAQARLDAAKADSSKVESESGGRRFRLPKLFADSADVMRSADLEMAALAAENNLDSPAPEVAQGANQSVLDIAERAIALDEGSPSATDDSVISTANRVFEGSPRAAVLRVSPGDFPEPKAEPKAMTSSSVTRDEALDVPAFAAAPETERLSLAERVRQLAASDSGIADDATLPTSTSVVEPIAASPVAAPSFQPVPIASAALSEDDSEALGGAILNEIMQLRDGMEEMNRTLLEMSERGDTQEKVFNTLHSELQDYKNDFIYEHLKPVVRPLLFLYDSMEQFDGELQIQMLPQPDERRRGLSPHVVRQNVSFFREQLVEALRICEVTPMAAPDGEFDAKLHKAVETVPVDETEDGRIVRVVRSGWYLNGRVFRPAEVVVGKKMEANARAWTQGKGA